MIAFACPSVGKGETGQIRDRHTSVGESETCSCIKNAGGPYVRHKGGIWERSVVHEEKSSAGTLIGEPQV